MSRYHLDKVKELSVSDLVAILVDDFEDVHEPTAIRRDVSFLDDKIHISEDLDNFQEGPLFVHTINLL